MTQSEAVTNLRIFMIQLQRYRSIALESYGPGSAELHLSEEAFAELWPWVFGAKCPLPILSKVLARVDGGEDLAPLDYYNLMFALHRFMPEVEAAICILYPKFPGEYPDIGILRGWE